MKYNADGSLTIYVQADSPVTDGESNWLPAPKDADFSLSVRANWPQESIMSGKWTPPAMIKTPRSDYGAATCRASRSFMIN